MKHRFKTCLFCHIMLCLVSVSCGTKSDKDGKEDEPEKMYSPICVYFDPLQNIVYDQYSAYFPYFVNYPDDWAKIGLHNRPIDMTYTSTDSWTGRRFSIKYYFNTLGQLVSINNSALGRDEFIYDDEGRLMQINRMANLGWDGKKNQFEYRDSLLVKRNVSPSHNTSHTFSYYPDGTLKEITPDKGIYYSERMRIGKLEFNEEGQLIHTESARSFNPFISGTSGIPGEAPSQCYFKYDDRGLCIEKLEKIAFKNYRNKIDTLTCVSRYDYNAQGDLTSWNYKGPSYEYLGNEWGFRDRDFTIRYAYKYDDNGNWITQNIIMPDCYQQVYSLLMFYEKENKGYFVSNQAPSAVPAGEKPKVTIQREIGGYHIISKETAEKIKDDNIKGKKDKLEEQKKMVKFSDVQALGLTGNVKKIDDKEMTIEFDEIGNITKKKDKSAGYTSEYTYDGPLTYKACPECDTRYVEFTSNQRKTTDKKYEEFDEIFTFDSKGRVIKYQPEGMMPELHYYSYNGNDTNPSSMVVEGADELGSWKTTYRYTYVDIDANGNWTKRKVKATTESEEYPEEGERIAEKSVTEGEPFVETRKISYY